MKKTITSCGVTLDVPEGTDVSEDGSVFAPNGAELAIYLEKADARAEDRQGAIEARCYVSAWGAAVMTPTGPQLRGLMDETADGWFVLYTTEDGELGFELGRRRPDRTVVFFGDRMTSPEAREAAISIARGAELA